MTMTLSTPDHTGTPIADHSDAGPDRVGRSRSGPIAPRPNTTIDRAADVASVGAIVFSGAIFGIFYAWVSTTMWGLDNADPRVAIEAMQEMNAAVRNAAFFPAFFLTPVVLALAAVLLHRSGRMTSARWFGGGAVVYLLGGLLLTMTVHVPMNEDLADALVPNDRAAAEAVWTDYSGDWQLWNIVRTVFCGIALTMAAIGLRLRHR